MFCPGCSQPVQSGHTFCGHCGRPLTPPSVPVGPKITYSPDELRLAGPGRRLSGFLLELLLVVVTFGIGWLIWSVFVYQRSQTPAKQILRMYVLQEDGTRAGGWYTLLREWVIKGATNLIIASMTLGIGQVVGAAWCIWDDRHQTVWDKVGATYIAWSPHGFRPQTAKELGLKPPPSPTPFA